MPTINSKINLMSKLKKGFTLIELLVVISIIGILASFITFSFTESQTKSRDSRRKADLESIKKALELAKQDSAGAYSYPRCDAYYTLGAYSVCGIDNTNTNPDMTPTYIKAIPLDPKNNNQIVPPTQSFVYIPTPAGCTGTTLCTGYSLVACLENSKDPQRDTTANTTICPASTNTYSYTITNL